VQGIVDDLDDSFASAAYGRTLQILGDGPGLLTPIGSEERVAAVLTLTRSPGPPFTDDDGAFVVELTRTVATFLEEALHLEAQREVATALQDAALPKALPSFDGIEIAAGYRAATAGIQVGGDWYRLSRLLTQQEPDAFATIICMEIDPRSGEGTWASAGHPAPIRVNSAGTSAHLAGDTAPPIGWMHTNSAGQAREYQLILNPGDRLLLFTDGLIERRGSDLGIGLAHLMIQAEQTRAMDAAAACETILRDVLAASHEDDVCLLIADFRPDP
jgi:serine phosphatase RsbU (regulator of sigma subunit)